MMHQISNSAGKRASTTTSVLDSTGILPHERVNVAGCMDLGLVDGTTALLQASLTTSWTETVFVSQQSFFQANINYRNIVCYKIRILFLLNNVRSVIYTVFHKRHPFFIHSNDDQFARNFCHMSVKKYLFKYFEKI